jgi:hypothetical protein
MGGRGENGTALGRGLAAALACALAITSWTGPVLADTFRDRLPQDWRAERGACKARPDSPGSCRVSVPALDYVICSSSRATN